MMNDMVLLSANVLAKQPEAVRDVAIGEAAAFVAGLPHVPLSREQAAEAIRQKVDSLTHSHWVDRVQKPGPQEGAQLS